MTELDYYSVMQKRIEYFARKYDPYDRLSVKEELVPEKIIQQKSKKIRQKISAGYSYIISILF
ncbi:MAG: hypothetical protein D4R97_02980 [Bacteroidetes bacterium]|nr:MAG: hypothetical protein D4R97_02980 [Bacteroidota bacterium]